SLLEVLQHTSLASRHVIASDSPFPMRNSDNRERTNSLSGGWKHHHQRTFTAFRSAHLKIAIACSLETTVTVALILVVVGPKSWNCEEPSRRAEVLRLRAHAHETVGIWNPRCPSRDCASGGDNGFDT